jgi:hypothetical protein
VIELNARTTDEVIPLLEPMLACGGTIGGLRDKLIIRTTPANLESEIAARQSQSSHDRV